jgi:hypothetical protein
MRYALEKHGLILKEENKLAISRCNSYRSVGRPLENINDYTISSEAEEELGHSTL